jgi:O-antigen/teichoic acid export membrane protein
VRRRVRDVLLGSSLRRRLVSGAFWSMCSSMFLRVTGFVNVVVLTRVFTAEQYGAYGLILTTLAMFGLLAGFEMGLTTTKYVAEHRETDPDRAGRVVGLGLMVTSVTATVMGLALFGASSLIAAEAFGNPLLRDELQLAAAILVATAVSAVLLGALAGLEAFSASAVLNMTMGLLTTAAVCVGGWLGGIAGALYGMLAAAILNVAVTHVVVRHWCGKFGIRIRFDVLEWTLIPRFGLPAVLRSIVSTPAVWIARSILAQQPDGMAQLGLFHAAWQWYALVMMIPEFWTRALVPVLSERMGAGAHGQFRRVILATTSINLIIVLAFSGAIYFLSDYVMLLYGRDLRFSDGLLLLALATGALSAASAPIGSALIATGTMWGAAALNAVWGITLTVFAYLLGRSPEGLATAYIVAYLLHIGMTSLLLWFVVARNERSATSAVGAPGYAHSLR